MSVKAAGMWIVAVRLVVRPGRTVIIIAVPMVPDYRKIVMSNQRHTPPAAPFPGPLPEPCAAASDRVHEPPLKDTQSVALMKAASSESRLSGGASDMNSAAPRPGFGTRVISGHRDRVSLTQDRYQRSAADQVKQAGIRVEHPRIERREERPETALDTQNTGTATDDNLGFTRRIDQCSGIGSNAGSSAAGFSVGASILASAT